MTRVMWFVLEQIAHRKEMGTVCELISSKWEWLCNGGGV